MYTRILILIPSLLLAQTSFGGGLGEMINSKDLAVSKEIDELRGIVKILKPDEKCKQEVGSAEELDSETVMVNASKDYSGGNTLSKEQIEIELDCIQKKTE